MKKTAYIGCLGMIGIISTEFGIIGILPQLAAHYAITIDKAGVLLSAFALVIALTGPFMTLLSSGFDRRKIMLLAISLFLITGIVSSLSPPFWLLMVVRVLPAFLQPVYIATAIAAAVEKGEKQHENQLMGIVMGGIAIAMVTTVPIATYLAGIFSWQASFVVQAVVSGIALLGILKALPPMPVREKKSYGSQLQILKKPTFLLSVAMNFFMIAAWFSTYSYFAEYLGKEKQMDTGMISIMLFLFGVMGVISNGVAGKMLGWSIPGTTAIFLLGTLAVPMALQYSGGGTTGIIIIVAFWGFMYAPCFLNASAYMISAAPDALEFANSLATSFGNLGVAVGTAVGGWIIAEYSTGLIPWAGMGFGILSLLMIGTRSLLEQRAVRLQQVTI
ncbi:MFS transporter [Flavobacterium kingsejongi]|uniref:MFS transporter n=1 Tax=Flavobacterium kingsejongi TaxID=1678728 RepID=A0A2S1LSW8_9FLAO|nr:MFS transporter [Flavobacterium kingsejongi]AWG26853.1 MFS transporter [Flavobacterium kingsejongi]